MVKAEVSVLIEEHQPTKIDLMVHPFIAAYLKKGFFSEERKWRKELGCKINIQAAESLHFMEYKVINAEGEEIQRKSR